MANCIVAFDIRQVSGNATEVAYRSIYGRRRRCPRHRRSLRTTLTAVAAIGPPSYHPPRGTRQLTRQHRRLAAILFADAVGSSGAICRAFLEQHAPRKAGSRQAADHACTVASTAQVSSGVSNQPARKRRQGAGATAGGPAHKKAARGKKPGKSKLNGQLANASPRSAGRDAGGNTPLKIPYSNDAGITFVAFTATPKNKTMEIFGTRPDPKRKPGPDNVPIPFHVYSMRQAIEEKFILDVLQNYTSYKLAFKLAHEGKEMDDREVERSAALKGIMGWVKLHPYNIAQKIEIVVEHFRRYVAPLLAGKAKAMVVVGSRVEAVHWQLAIDKYIKERGYKIGTLVAFSGEVNDKASGPDGFTENSPALNPNLKGRDIREAFKGDEYQILLVANKFQTGFDQPLLCGMYVDRRLAGIQAVQTLSRLNRAYPGKDTTYVIDFVNEPAEVLEAFKAYYATAELETTTDPNLVFNLRAKLDAGGYYDDFEVDRVVAVELDPKAKQSDLVAALDPVVDRLMKRYKAAQQALNAAREKEDDGGVQTAEDELNALILFRSDMGAYVRLYTFLSQIFDYGNTAVEKRAIFYKRLIPLLEFGREREGIDLSKVVLTHHNLKDLGKRPMQLSDGAAPKLEPITEAGSGSIQEKEKAYLAEIIEKVNDLFEGDLSDQDKLVYVNNVIKGKLLESEKLRQQAANNTKEQFANSPDLKSELLNAIMGALDAHNAMSTQALNSEGVQQGLKEVLLNNAGLYESLRAQT